MTTTQYNSNNSLTAEFKIYDSNLTFRHKTGTIQNPRQKLQLSTIHYVFKIRESARFKA